MQKISISRIAGLALFTFIFLLGTSLYSQDKDAPKANDTYKQNAKTWTEQLTQKVTLTSDQQTSVEGILVDYQGARAASDMKGYDQLQKTYNEKIQTVLNENQKKLYADFSSQWWNGMYKPMTENTMKQSQ